MSTATEMVQGNSTKMTMLRTVICVVAILIAGLVGRPLLAEDVEPAGGDSVPSFSIYGFTNSVQFGQEITVLSNGNFVVTDPNFHWGGNVDAGLVALYDGVTFKHIAHIRGGEDFAQIGIGGVTALLDGNFVIESPFYSKGGQQNVGAVTWCSGTTGCTGILSAENSLSRSLIADSAGSSITPLADGGYLVRSPGWGTGGIDDQGAVTHCPAGGGCNGTLVSPGNSLVGTTEDDKVGEAGVTLLANGDYVVRAPKWDNGLDVDAGAVRRCPVAGCVGTMDATNSLVGGQAFDQIGYAPTQRMGAGYVVVSPYADFLAIADAGAVTYCENICTGTTNAVNSLVGSTLGDMLGIGGVQTLGTGAYLVTSPNWTNGLVASAGAVTYCEMPSGCAGGNVVGRSLYGTTASDTVGDGGTTVLSNGNYAVASPSWTGSAMDEGAVTWCSGADGCLNVAVSEANSLHGATINDRIGQYGVRALSNGAYIVRSPLWDNMGVIDAGAVSFCSGATGCTPAPVSAVNSLVGVATLDSLGEISVLSNGNYVVSSTLFNVGAHTDGGKAVFCSGVTGCTGGMDSIAGLQGSHPGQNVGAHVTALRDGNFSVMSKWTRNGVADVGAVTWCSGTIGCPVEVNDNNSIYGSVANDWVGSDEITAGEGGVTVVVSKQFDGPNAADGGAVSILGANGAFAGPLSTSNSVFGEIAGAGVTVRGTFNDVHKYLIVGLPSEKRVVILLATPSVAVRRAGNDDGSVQSAPAGIECGATCYATFTMGASVTLTATPSESAEFTGWSGACAGVGDCVMNIDAGKVVTATFLRKTYEVLVSEASTGGAVEVTVEAVPAAAEAESVLAAGVDMYSHGTVLRFTAVPDPGFVFERWTNSLSGSSNPIQVSVERPMVIGAIFRPSDIADVGTYLPLIEK